MAYVNLINQVVADKAEAFTRIRDFICKRNGTHDYSTTGIGWTLIDSSYAVDEDNPQVNDWVVFKSVGEGGNEDLYFRFRWSSTDFDITGMLYWNTSTHVGLVYYATTINTFEFNAADTNIPLYIYGDLDSVFLVFDGTADDWVNHFGKLEKPYSDLDETIANCTSGALTAGSDKSITLDSVPSSWGVGDHIYIWSSDATTSNAEKIEIKTIVSNVITADLTKAYAVGSKMSKHVGYCASDNLYYQNTHKTLIDGFGVSGTINYSFVPIILSSYNQLAYSDPDPFNSNYGLSPSLLGSSTHGISGIIKNVYQVGVAGLATGDILIDGSGVEYRYFKSSAYGLVVKEV